MKGEVAYADTFRSGWWLPGPHLQTVWGRLARSRRLVEYRREALETPDGDTLFLDHVDGPAGFARRSAARPRGHSFSVPQDSRPFRNAGWSHRAEFRSCALARRPGDFHPERPPVSLPPGETTDFASRRADAASREPDTPLFAAGSRSAGTFFRNGGRAGSATRARRGDVVGALRPRGGRALHGERGGPSTSEL